MPLVHICISVLYKQPKKLTCSNAKTIFQQTPLRPYSYQANMEVWSFYLDDHLSQFPSYDTELISDGPLTLLDMHHNFFEKEKSLSLMGMRVDHPGPAASEISSLLWQYTG